MSRDAATFSAIFCNFTDRANRVGAFSSIALDVVSIREELRIKTALESVGFVRGEPDSWRGPETGPPYRLASSTTAD